MDGMEPSRGSLLRNRRRLRSGRAFLLIFALCFSVQGFFLTKVPEAAIRPNTLWEFPSVAVSMAMYSALWGMLPWVAGRVGLGGRAGVLAGLVGGIIPRWPGHGEGLAALALALLMMGFLRRWERERNTTCGSILLGIGAGVAFHVQPALLAVVLGWMAFELWWWEARRARLHTGLVALGVALACLPWGWRNYRALDAVFFIRSNFGLELRMGNHEGVATSIDAMDRRGEEYVHPRALEREARKVQELGEVPYMRRAGREAVDWIRANPGSFAELTAARVALWWLGPLYDPLRAPPYLALTLLAVLGAWLTFPALSVPQRAAVLIPLLAFPLVYYVMAYMPRYREPIDWIFMVLAGAAVWQVAGHVRGSAARPQNAGDGAR